VDRRLRSQAPSSRLGAGFASDHANVSQSARNVTVVTWLAPAARIRSKIQAVLQPVQARSGV